MANSSFGARVTAAMTCIVMGMALPMAAKAGAPSGQAYPRGETSLARELNGRVAGEPVSCIDSRTVVDTWVVERTAILYRMRDGTVYVNRPSQGAEGLARDSVRGGTGYQTLCERFGVGMFSAGGKGVRGSTAARLGTFTPYTRP
jgi:hypothetical protein